MVQFANLPDDCYFLIFVRLSTSTLLSCRGVSRAWLRNQQQVFRQRKVLILLQGNSPTKLLTDSHFQSAFISHGIDQNGQPMAFDQFVMRNQVNLCSFDQNVTRFLAKTFPNVDTLIIVHDGISSENVNNALTDLLQQYSSKVVALKMYFNYRGETGNVINPNIHKVIGQLNSMSALEHVTLESHNPSGLSLRMSNKDLNFLTRVKQFYYYSPHISKTWFDVLRQLEESTNAAQLEHIGLGLNKWVANEPFGHWLLADRFTHFPYNTYLLNTGSSSHFEQSIGPFRCLTSFTILQNGRMAQPPSFLAKKLTTLSVHCPSLVHLKIIVGMDYRSVFVQPFDPSTIEPLQSVKVLDLAFRYFDLSQIDVQAKPFVHTFPNLVSIRIICHKVGFDFIKIKENKDVKFVNFFRQLKATLGRETLRTVYCEESADLLTDFLLSY